MVGYGVDIHAPRPPFVLFKVLYRNSALENVLGPIYLVVRTVCRVVMALVGYLVGFLLGASEGSSSSSSMLQQPQPVSRDQRIPRPRWAPDLSLLDDEFL